MVTKPETAWERARRLNEWCAECGGFPQSGEGDEPEVCISCAEQFERERAADFALDVIMGQRP